MARAWGEAGAILDALGLDELCRKLAIGDNLAEIARGLKISPVTLSDWIAAVPERSARTREARIIGSYAHDQLALEVLLDEDMEIPRARELASHYRWRAKVANPREYGDKTTTEHQGSIEIVSKEQRDAAVLAATRADS